ncbi:MAG: hypothetical protein AABY93_10520 [Bacteroidota bacterium]
MSHVKNVQAFGKLKGICTGYGGQYNPGQQNLQVNAMSTLLNSAQQTMEDLNEAQTIYDNATNNRVLGFKGIRKLSSRILSVLQSSGAHPLTVADARVSVRKVWGARSKRVTEPPKAAEQAKTSIVYGQDYVSIAYHFAKLVETVSAEAQYNPNEEELSVEGMHQRLEELHSLNDAVTNAEIVLGQARRKRNALYYTGDGNLFSTALAAKQYVRGVFGFGSTQHLEVRRVRFTKPKL